MIDKISDFHVQNVAKIPKGENLSCLVEGGHSTNDFHVGKFRNIRIWFLIHDCLQLPLKYRSFNFCLISFDFKYLRRQDVVSNVPLCRQRGAIHIGA